MGKIFWSEDRPPTLREYPMVLCRAVLAGAVMGPAMSWMAMLLFKRPLTHAFDQWPLLLLYSAYAGSVFTLSFFVCWGLPWGYLRPLLKDYPARAKGIIIALIGAFGAMLAFTIAVGLLSLTPPLHLWGRETSGRCSSLRPSSGCACAADWFLQSNAAPDPWRGSRVA